MGILPGGAKSEVRAGVVGCSNLTAGGLENCGLMTPEAASLAGPKLRAVCESLGIPPALNFGPCLAIGRPEMVATELARALNVADESADILEQIIIGKRQALNI